MGNDNLRRVLARGELVPLLYRLGHQGASGVLTITARQARAEVFVLRRGQIVVGGSGELEKRAIVTRLVRLAAQDVTVLFEGGVNGVVPLGAAHRVALVEWARAHLEAQLDGTLAEAIARQLAGARLTLRPETAPPPRDEADRRMLLAMAQPRRLDQIWPLARTPRFRLLAFVHFLMSVDALVAEGVVTERSGRVVVEPPRTPEPPLCPRRIAAMQLLGIDETADAFAVKRAYRRLARALHPDLQPEVDATRRRILERRFAEVTAAYEALL